MDWLAKQKFNSQQLEAICYQPQSLMVIAGAGSGKTAVLTNRIYYLIHHFNFQSQKILAFTFTNKAANEMKQRLHKMLPDLSFPYIGTFHGICYKILKIDIDKLEGGHFNEKFIICDETDQLYLVKNLFQQVHKHHGENKIKLSNVIAKKYLTIVEQIKMQQESEASAVWKYLQQNQVAFAISDQEVKILTDMYFAYNLYLQNNNLIDFYDLLYFTKKLLTNYPDLQHKWSQNFQYLLVDEFQDTDQTQFEIIKLLSRNMNNVFVVGDPDQMIYSWRGIKSDIFVDFEQAFQNNHKVFLERNYRSTPAILKTSNKLIAHNQNRIIKNLYADDATKKGELIFFAAPRQNSESAFIVNKINELVTKHNFAYQDIAILYRAAYLSRNLEDHLIRSKIPYEINQGYKFFQRKEIKTLIYYLRLIANQNDVMALDAIYNYPKRKIGPINYEKLKSHALVHNLSLFELFQNPPAILKLAKNTVASCQRFYQLITALHAFEQQQTSLVPLFQELIKRLDYFAVLQSEGQRNKINNVLELERGIKQFEAENPNVGLETYLQQLSLLINSSDEQNENENSVKLMTIHAAKGLEFPNVFIIQFNEGILPHYKSVLSENVEEERRIAYVAITRAKQNLYLSCDLEQRNQPSPFIDELLNKNIQLHKVSPNNVSWQKPTGLQPDQIQPNLFNNVMRDQPIEYQIGDEIYHQQYGDGIVLQVFEKTLLVVFNNKKFGTKTLLKNHKAFGKKYD